MSDFATLNQHQKKSLVIQLYEQGRTRRQIAEVAHMSFKDIADVIKKHTGEESESVDKPQKSKGARAFQLFLQGKQSVEVAIELDISADEVEELHVQYWRLAKLDDLEDLYHEAKYSLPLLLQLFKILKDNRITKEKDIRELIELANHGLPDIRNRLEESLVQVASLDNERAALNTEMLGLTNSIYKNNAIIRKKDQKLRTLDRRLRQLEVMLHNVNKDPNYNKIIGIVDQSLNDKKSLLAAALIAILQTLKANPYGLNLLNSSSLDIEDYVVNDIDGKYLLQFAESCYDTLLKSYVKTIV